MVSAPHESAPKPMIDAIIQCAMDSEVEPFFALAAPGTHQPQLAQPDLFFASQPAWALRTDGFSALLVKSGIGVANAAMTAALALHATAAPLLISAGSLGGLGTQVQVGDVLVGARYRYALVDATAFGYEPGQVPGQPAFFTAPTALVDRAVAAGATAGEILTSDVFVMSHNVEDFRQRFPQALGVEMESAAAAQVAHNFGVSFLAIRGVSDLCGPTADQQNHADAGKVTAAAAPIVAAVVTDFTAALHQVVTPD